MKRKICVGLQPLSQNRRSGSSLVYSNQCSSVMVPDVATQTDQEVMLCIANLLCKRYIQHKLSSLSAYKENIWEGKVDITNLSVTVSESDTDVHHPSVFNVQISLMLNSPTDEARLKTAIAHDWYTHNRGLGQLHQLGTFSFWWEIL